MRKSSLSAFRKEHSREYTLFAPPPQILHNLWFKFLLGFTVAPREIKDYPSSKCLGTNKVCHRAYSLALCCLTLLHVQTTQPISQCDTKMFKLLSQWRSQSMYLWTFVEKKKRKEKKRKTPAPQATDQTTLPYSFFPGARSQEPGARSQEPSLLPPPPPRGKFSL